MDGLAFHHLSPKNSLQYIPVLNAFLSPMVFQHAGEDVSFFWAALTSLLNVQLAKVDGAPPNPQILDLDKTIIQGLDNLRIANQLQCLD